MSQKHDQDDTNGQKPDLNKIQPGMEVEDTAYEPGEQSIQTALDAANALGPLASKPRNKAVDALDEVS
jgi:hypothetical protein